MTDLRSIPARAGEPLKNDASKGHPITINQAGLGLDQTKLGYLRTGRLRATVTHQVYPIGLDDLLRRLS